MLQGSYLPESMCAYWDYLASPKSASPGNWSTEGCVLHDVIDGRVICHCDHLTNFAILTVSQVYVYNDTILLKYNTFA